MSKRPTTDPLRADGETSLSDHAMRMATLGELLAMVTHEVANTLSPVGTYAQLALRHPDDHALAQKALMRAAAAVDRVSRVTDAVLALSKADVPRGTASVGQCLDSAVDCLGRDLTRDQIQLVRQLEPGADVAIPPVALEHILLNLLLNARSSLMTVGGGTIAVRARTSAGVVVVEVEDDGPGFETSPGTETKRRAKRTGTGWGLVVIRRLAEAAGGSVEIWSKPGEGARFTIRLPAAAGRLAA